MAEFQFLPTPTSGESMMLMTSMVRNFGRRELILGCLAMRVTDGLALGRRRAVRAFLESWPPYVHPGDGGEAAGLDAELLQAICDEAGFELVWVRTPRARRRRRFQELLDDRFDVVFSATPVPHDERLVAYSRTYRQEMMMVAAPSVHDPVLDGLRDFDDLISRRIRILCADAGGLGKDFEAHRDRLQYANLLVPYPTTRLGIEMLRAGRGQLILGDALDLQAQARMLSFPLVRQPYGFSAEPVSLLLSRRHLNPGDLARIDRAIEVLEQRGVLATIRGRYAVVPSADSAQRAAATMRSPSGPNSRMSSGAT